MLEQIWSGWRAAYVTDEASSRSGTDDSGPDAPSASVFTQLLAAELPDEETYILHRGTTVFALANIHPYTSGHVLVVPYRQVVDLVDLRADEVTDLWATVTEAVSVVREEYRPDGLNVGLNLGRPAGGSIPNHLHVHVVPRWTGDSNFLAATANAQTLPEALDVSAGRLRRAWAARHS